MINIPEEKLPHTHKVTMTLYSNGPEEMVSVRVKWDPDVEGKHISEIGFLPAAYQFLQEFIVPAIEEGYMKWSGEPMILLQPQEKSH